ncbi:MAG: hypothetical protein ACHQE5_04570, partial [Actinomycetes bacterium]
MPVPNRSARLVAWSNAVALGLASPDLAAAEVSGSDPPHRVDGLPGGDGQTLPVLLAKVRRHAAATARLVLPVPGDPVGLPGPGALAGAALAAGEVALLPDAFDAAICSPGGWGLVPAEETTSVRWTAYAVADPAPAAHTTALADADRGLAETLREATALLDRLDVASWDDRDADEIAALRSGRLDGDGLAPGYPERAVSVLVRARRVRTIVRLACRADGAALTAAEASARLAALEPLDRAARPAEMAAYNALAD